jgi:hypothetical protein
MRVGSTAAVVGFLAAAVAAVGQELDVQVVSRPPTDQRNPHYISNREPLAPSAFIKLPPGAVEPGGWIRTQLELMRDGMTGHLPELSHWVRPEDSAWLSPSGEGKNGWEELPYWLKGLGNLGYVLHDEKTTGQAKQWIEGVLKTQRPDGYFGPEQNRQGGPENMQLGIGGTLKVPDLWPHMPMIDALRSYHEVTHDERVITLLTGYFKWQHALPKEHLLAASWQKLRGGDNLESVLWLYNRTGDAWLLDLAKKIHEQTSPWHEKVASWHGVNICQGYREPAVYWQLSQDPEDLQASERNYQEVMGLYGQVPGGMFGADEIARKGHGDPRQAAETCSMVEFMHSFEQLLRITGDPVHADRCEEVAFNSLPAAFTADYRGLHYLTAPNMVQLDAGNKAPGIFNSGTMFSYDPGEVYRCCQHNHAFGWPYFAEHLWMATQDGGLVAAMYGECSVTAKVADGAEVTIRQKTDYPFDEKIVLTISAQRPVAFPLYLRVPGWSDSVVLSLTSDGATTRASRQGTNGRYVVVDRTWAEGDTIELLLSARVEHKTWRGNKDSASIRRGPLWYSLKIGEKYVPLSKGVWPAIEVYPTTPWNFGIIIDSVEQFRVERTGRIPARQPWDAELAPIKIAAKGKRIPGWKVDSRGMAQPLQQSPIRTGEPEETIELIPMGAARLRISAFPVIGDGPDAKEWIEPPPPRHEASYEFDDINALSDGREPQNSGDHAIPRYTWWNHKGTTEWVTYKLGASRKVSSVSVYWFDDTGAGACRVPESWRLLYKDGGEWKPVANPSGYPVQKDAYSTATFDPVTTDELRLEVKLRPQYSGGILEWRVGETKQ